MKLLRSSIVLITLVGVASAQFKNPFEQVFDGSAFNGAVDGLKNGSRALQGALGDLGDAGRGVLEGLRSGNLSLQDAFGDLGDAGKEVLGGFDDVLKDLGLTAANLTQEMIENIKNTTQELVEVLLNPANTFKVKLNQNVIIPFSRGIDMLSGNSRTFSDKKYDYDYVNYVEEGQVSPVKDQGQCGSCYAFAAVASVESLYLRNQLGAKVFSEQQIIDCSMGMYQKAPQVINNGCKGGTSNATLMYFNQYDVSTVKKYPYEAKVGKCAVNAGSSKQHFNFTTVLVDNEDHLAQILNKNGPVVIYIFVGKTFNYYAGGIYNDFVTTKQPVDHAVLVVGIEKDWMGTEYWIIKNSWGSKWGDQGYIKFAKGYNIGNMITNPVIVANLGPIST